MWNAPTHQKRDPHYLYRGGFIPSIGKDKKQINKENQNQQPDHKDMLLQDMGAAGGTP